MPVKPVNVATTKPKRSSTAKKGVKKTKKVIKKRSSKAGWTCQSSVKVWAATLNPRSHWAWFTIV